MPENQNSYGARQTVWPAFGLFASLGTLVCCALPALLVSLGAGAALAGLVSTVPWLITLSKYKVWTFGIAAAMILFAGLMQWRSRNLPCPADPLQAVACMCLRRFSQWIFWLSVVVWCTGFFFAFIAVHVFN